MATERFLTAYTDAHPNMVDFIAYRGGTELAREWYYSIGGGEALNAVNRADLLAYTAVGHSYLVQGSLTGRGIVLVNIQEANNSENSADRI